MKTEGIKGDGFLRASVGYARIMLGYWEKGEEGTRWGSWTIPWGSRVVERRRVQFSFLHCMSTRRLSARVVAKR